jgi:hypothetical protein
VERILCRSPARVLESAEQNEASKIKWSTGTLERKEKNIESSNLTLQVVIHVHASASDRHSERFGEVFSGAGLDSIM